MATVDKRKVFISWSKDHSRQVALVLEAYLPEILDGIEIFMSDRDIDPGERSLDVIEAQLAGSTYGLLIVTAENQGEAWLNFEAGALSKTVGTGKENLARVVPLLVNISGPSQLVGPISQFQAVMLDREGLLKTLNSIARLVGSEPAVVTRRFDRAWPEMEEALARTTPTSTSAGVSRRKPEDKIDEMLEILRSLNRSVTSVAPEGSMSMRDSEVTTRQAKFTRAVNEADDIVRSFGGLVIDANGDSTGRLTQLFVDNASNLPMPKVREEVRERLGYGVVIIPTNANSIVSDNASERGGWDWSSRFNPNG